MRASAYRFLKYGIVPEGESREDWERAEEQYIDDQEDKRHEEREAGEK